MDINEMELHFSGGVLMSLLADAQIRSRTPVTLMGKQLFLNEGNFFLSMIRLIRPIHNPYNANTLKKQTSLYKNCQISLRSDIPFHEDIYVNHLKDRMARDYYRLMEEAYEVFNTFLRISDEQVRVPVADRIVRTVKEVISMDSSIPEDALFPVQPDGSALTKRELIDCTRINIYSFLMGVFTYACEKIPDNTVGADTIRYLVLAKGSHGQKAMMREDIGSSITQDLDISFELPVLPEEQDDVVPCAPILNDRQIRTFQKYLEPLYESKYCVPTLMYRNRLTPLYDFYVAPVLRKRDADAQKDPGPYIARPTPAKLLAYSKHLLLLGDGGMGKSTVILDLLLQSISNFQSTGILPLFIELKEFRTPCDSLELYLYNRTKSWWDHSFRSFTMHLERYQTIIFLDGFDEMRIRDHRDFSILLQEFTRRFPKAQVIVSSRLVGNVVSMIRFRSVEVVPFSKEQCTELIRKYDFRPDRPEIKETFLRKLEEGDLYKDHMPIAQNPLLCTMMLRIFSSAGRIPGSITRFYAQAFQILAEDHDSTKVFERHLRCGLPPKDLKTILEEVCMYAYSDEQYSFTTDEMGRYLMYLNAYTKLGIKPLRAEDLLTDLKENICLMVENDEGVYNFIGNRYFENYFTAVYLSMHLEGHSDYAIELFERDKYKRDSDHVLDMLFDIDRLTTQTHLYLPKLRRIFDKVDSLWDACERKAKRNDGTDKDRFCCFAYLKECYDTISYTSGTVLYEAANYPVSPLLNSILEINQFHEELSDKDIDNPEDSFTEEVFYEYCRDKESDPEIITFQDIGANGRYADVRIIDDAPCYNPEEDSYTIREVGRSYIIIPDKLNNTDHTDIIESLTAPRSPYFREYMCLRSYYEKLKEQVKTTQGNVFRRSSLTWTA